MPLLLPNGALVATSAMACHPTRVGLIGAGRGVYRSASIHTLGGGPSRYYSLQAPRRLALSTSQATPVHLASAPLLTPFTRGYATISPESQGGQGRTDSQPSAAALPEHVSPMSQLEIERVKDSYVMDHHIYEKDRE